MTALTRASVVRTLAVLAIVLIAGGNASAQSYPTKAVRMIVPFGAGGPADVFARVLAQHLQETFKQNFVVENRPGAGAIIGTDRSREGGARRLHAAGDVEHPHRQRVADPEAALMS